MEDSDGRHRWDFGPIAPRQGPSGLFVLILSVAVSVFFAWQGVDGIRSIMLASEPATAEEPSAVLQRVVLPIAGCFLFLFGGGFLGSVFLRAGIERYSLVIERDSVTLEQSMFGRNRRRRYLRQYVGDLRVAEDVPDEIPEDQKGSFSPDNGGVLRFRYGSHTVFCGPQTARPEAEDLLRRIVAVAPDLAEPAPIPSETEAESADWRQHADIVSPFADRCCVEPFASTLRVTIPARSSKYGRLFVTIWLAGWLLFIVLVGVVLWVESSRLGSGNVDAEAKHGARMAIAFCSVWLFFWSIGGLLAVWSAVWSRWGRQIIEISDSEIVVSNRSPLWRSRRAIDRQKYGPISLRASLGYFESFTTGNDRGDSSSRGGWLECRSGFSKEHFGAGLTRREAEYLLVRLQRIDPSLVDADRAARAI